jgi:hypothetical protein
MTKKLMICVQTVLIVSVLIWARPADLQIAHAQDHGNRAVGAPAPSEERRQQDRKKELEEMRRRAQGTKVWQVRGADKIPAELVPEPVYRFSSEFPIATSLRSAATKGRAKIPAFR